MFPASAIAHHRVWANSDTWADVSDVAQDVPMVWAAGRTLHGADREDALQLAAAGALTVGSGVPRSVGGRVVRVGEPAKISGH